MTRELKKGNYVALFTIVVIAVIIIANLVMGKIPAEHRKWDLSTSQILILGDTTKDILSKLDKDVTIHIIASSNSVDERIRSFISLYADQSPRIRVVEDDPVLHPDVPTILNAQPGQTLMVCEETGGKTAISLNDIIQVDLMAYYQYQQVKEIAFDGEGQITSAVSYVTSDNETAVHTLTKHQESALSATVKNALEKSGMILSGLNLVTDSTIPQDYGLLIINSPQTDIGQDEAITLTDYLKNGGHLLLLSGVTQNHLTNLSDLCLRYGVDIKDGFMADSAPRHFYDSNPFYIIPEYDFSSGLLSGVDSKQAALAIQPSGMTIQEDLKDGLAVTPFLTTLDSGMLVDPATQGKTEGTYVLTAVAVETASEEENTASMFTMIAAPELVSDDVLTSSPNIINLAILMSAVSYKIPGVTAPSIPSKSLDITCNMIISDGLRSALFIIVILVVFLITEFVVWMKHRRL